MTRAVKIPETTLAWLAANNLSVIDNLWPKSVSLAENSVRNHALNNQLRAHLDAVMERDPNGLDPHAGGAKLDAGKVRPSLILSDMPRAMLAIAEVGTFGANKYSDGGWLEVKDGVKRYDDAADRHRLKRCIEGEFDLDSHLSHRAHQAWNDIAALELYLRAKEGVK